jgi:hypothetical protein
MKAMLARVGFNELFGGIYPEARTLTRQTTYIHERYSPAFVQTIPLAAPTSSQIPTYERKQETYKSAAIGKTSLHL